MGLKPHGESVNLYSVHFLAPCLTSHPLADHCHLITGIPQSFRFTTYTNVTRVRIVLQQHQDAIAPVPAHARSSFPHFDAPDTARASDSTTWPFRATTT